MKTVAPLLMARMASVCKEVLAGRTPLARRWTIVRGRERSCLRWPSVSHRVGVVEKRRKDLEGGESPATGLFEVTDITDTESDVWDQGGTDSLLRY